MVPKNKMKGSKRTSDGFQILFASILQGEPVVTMRAFSFEFIIFLFNSTNINVIFYTEKNKLPHSRRQYF